MIIDVLRDIEARFYLGCIVREAAMAAALAVTADPDDHTDEDLEVARRTAMFVWEHFEEDPPDDLKDLLRLVHTDPMEAP